jgi:hypothetical protein
MMSNPQASPVANQLLDPGLIQRLEGNEPALDPNDVKAG